LIFLAALALAFVAAPTLRAQFQMPDPKQMAGIPRPVDDLPSGSVSVRLIKGDLSNNIVNHPVELHVGDKVQVVNTDDGGRAQFDKLPAGTTLKAVAVVDGERLESQEFPVPAQGGIRLMLVATDKEKEARAAAEASAPAISGQVVIGNESYIIVEPGDEVVSLYYLLHIQNTARTPVNPPSPFMFDLPSGARAGAVLEGSSPRASVVGNTVRVQGPFPPGDTFVQIGCELPAASGSVDIAQRFPAQFQQLAVMVKKEGNARLASPQIERQQEMPANGQAVIVGAGGAVAAGQPVTLNITGLPHHSSMGESTALSIAGLIVLGGVWLSGRRPSDEAARVSERKRLVARREKLFQELVRLETDHRQHRVDQAAYAARREQLLQTLERVYGALDTDEPSPEPADRAGLAA
jgi:hypothetical protein